MSQGAAKAKAVHVVTDEGPVRPGDSFVVTGTVERFLGRGQRVLMFPPVPCSLTTKCGTISFVTLSDEFSVGSNYKATLKAREHGCKIDVVKMEPLF